jgi:hypothetical protein
MGTVSFRAFRSKARQPVREFLFSPRSAICLRPSYPASAKATSDLFHKTKRGLRCRRPSAFQPLVYVCTNSEQSAAAVVVPYNLPLLTIVIDGQQNIKYVDKGLEVPHTCVAFVYTAGVFSTVTRPIKAHSLAHLNHKVVQHEIDFR